MDRFDCVIVGAGIAGLWCRALLEEAGYSTLTMEKSAAGDGQSIASQGILHRGLKYRLLPAAQTAAGYLEDAHQAWEKALQGEGPVDLRRVSNLTRTMHMWAGDAGGSSSIFGMVTAAMASVMMKSDAIKLTDPNLRPPAFAKAPKDTLIYEVQETCLDSKSLLKEMLRTCRGTVEQDAPLSIKSGASGVEITTVCGRVVQTGMMIATAGNGNEAIAKLAGVEDQDIMQRRPLRMVMMQGAPFEIYGHCLQPLSDKPKLTISTAKGPKGLVWWLGGSLAEDGVERQEVEQCVHASRMVRECVPWADLSKAAFASVRIDRAEGRQPSGKRPDGPMIRQFGRVMLAWPTKLALAPSLAQTVVARARETIGAPAKRGDSEFSPLADGSADSGRVVAPAAFPWESKEVQWTGVRSEERD